MKRLLAVAFAIAITLTAQASQTPRFDVRFSKPLAVYAFVYNLSSRWGPMTLGGPNAFKTLFKGSPYDQLKYQSLIADFGNAKTAYDFAYPDYAGLDKMGLSTESLLWKELANSQNAEEFKQSAIGIIPNPKLFKVAEILTAFEPVYDELVYKPNKESFETQLRNLQDLISKTDMGRYFDIGIKFYGAAWDSSVPVNLYVYPLPNSRGFTATIFFNNCISGIPSSMTEFHGLLSVMFHEMFHILFDEQPISLMNEIAAWRKANPSKATHYAFSLLNEALATSLANGYISSQLNGKLNEGNWYNNKHIDQMAKTIYPLVTRYIESGRQIDKPFVDEYIRLFDQHHSAWLQDLEFVMVMRSAVSDHQADFEIIDKKFPYNTTAKYRTPITEGTLQELERSQTTKVVFITSDHQRKLDLVKTVFPWLKSWKPDAKKDFVYVQMLNDKSYLVIVSAVDESAEELFETLKL